ncbi:hypothetical protein [Saccharomonospora sp.]|uniref:hypothetical protein n=1 Tax=Saccharomonospora sp. TaxID=33913 RepID=UPI0026102CA8|nr:hypothetical protein [Saccharomonospora sp.]
MRTVAYSAMAILGAQLKDVMLVSQDETVLAELSALDTAPVGKEFNRADYVLLLVLGVVIPAVLLAWGWL